MRRPIPVSLGTATIGTIRRKMTNTKKVTGIMRLNWKNKKKEKYLSLLMSVSSVLSFLNYFIFFLSLTDYIITCDISLQRSALSPVFIFFWSHVTHLSKAAREIRWSPSKNREVALLARKSFVWHSHASFMFVISILEFLLDNSFSVIYSISAFCAHLTVVVHGAI